MIGTKLAHYEITSHLGTGGMGEVYQATDTKLGRSVAIKFLPEIFMHDADRSARFEREARVLASLNHPNIAAIYGIEESGGRKFLVMELVLGETVAQRIQRGPILVDEALGIAKQIAQGLEGAHEKNVIHRDLKPVNVKITPDGKVKVLDFGLAKVPETKTRADDEAQTGSGLTRTGTLLGTVAYMSPEQARGEEVDSRTDLFSLGAVLYEMTTGQVLFPGRTTAMVFAEILSPRPAPVTGNLPSAVRAIIQKAVAKDRTKRYATATQMGDALGSAGAAPTEALQKRSIAVLSFSDMSQQKDQDYFCEGMAEELINALTKVDGMRVASRTSSFQFKGKNEDICSIAERLGVEFILAGSVRKSGNKLRITTQLIKAADGYHLWSDRFDRDMEDIFAVYDEIAQTIVETLRAQLDGDSAKLPEKLVRRYTDNVEAYNLYLQGRHYWGKRLVGLMWKGIECFKKAIELDPSYALAYTGLVESYYSFGWYGILPPSEVRTTSRTYADKALSLDGQLAEAHYADAIVKYLFEWDLLAAGDACKQALKLNPALALVWSWQSALQQFFSRAESMECARKAMELEPDSPLVAATVAWVMILIGENELALEISNKAVELGPENLAARWVRGLILLETPNRDEGVHDLEKAVAIMGRRGFPLSLLGLAYGSSGRIAEAREILAELEGSRSTQLISPLCFCLVYLGLGEKEMALDCFQAAVAARDPMILSFQSPMFDSIRHDPRFQCIADAFVLGSQPVIRHLLSQSR